MVKLSSFIVASAVIASVEGFSVPNTIATRSSVTTTLFAEEEKPVEAAFVPLEPAESESVDDEIPIEKVESLGRGAAKAKRGKRKGAVGAAGIKEKKAAVTLTPEETFYEGPPAITETIVPTISILTVVGIIPAAAAWARQAWVRYRITSRRIRVTSGIGGNDMAEIVYPDIVEIRTVKRLFGDGDMVLFLRDGAKFEMRNVPEFENALEFILDKCDKDVAEKYREGGDVTQP
mmetsp:Transcript_31959/g.45449  ORF Transcript_31959/g.45449 Transcript_31959/m.45449 type:complete len:233 (+) Transcript_31959:63-761(+)|eukprot:CAMPEP_0202458582 /NCGR_PEP_ID=MMETSP1360-20130828/26466_1 /ASSEMBLY_ACC=CAM_ASM_000848 /TAXON_ID=515479 /ORGANISM="Licmophora paradoxa, Strain CCMP2313" /LENGTH=232 /DNA_ID=CAMNT_0049079189 /DNA_START=63 /DNA_END=761 /DNA_ORIENTATION=+